MKNIVINDSWIIIIIPVVMVLLSFPISTYVQEVNDQAAYNQKTKHTIAITESTLSSYMSHRYADTDIWGDPIQLEEYGLFKINLSDIKSVGVVDGRWLKIWTNTGCYCFVWDKDIAIAKKHFNIK